MESKENRISYSLIIALVIHEPYFSKIVEKVKVMKAKEEFSFDFQSTQFSIY